MKEDPREGTRPADSSSSFNTRDQRSQELFMEYVDRLNAGEPIDRQRIRAAHPELAADLIEQLEAFEAFSSRGEEGKDLGKLGDYRLLRKVGRGGMGIVYEALQSSMDRRVALKVLPAAVEADTRAVTRFIREAKLAGKLRHPNVVPVYGIGVEANTPYYAMEFVEGETLAQILARLRAENGGAVKDHANLLAAVTRRFKRSSSDADRKTQIREDEEHPPPEAPGETQPAAAPWQKSPLDTGEVNAIYCFRVAEAFAGVAEGLQHAHERSIIHRDIKPSNLILDMEGQLRILDFGLARLEGQESLTASGDLVGTVLYMSPEQAMARRIPIDRRTDIYSLGASLYEMLAWRPPFQGKDSQDTLSKIIFAEPAPPSRLNPRIPRDLETVALKCLRKSPEERYGTAEALAQDLRRFVRGDPIEARPQSRWEKLRRRLWRHRIRVGLAAGLLIAIIAATAAAWNYYREAASGRQARWAREEALPEAKRLFEEGKYLNAFQLTLQAESSIPGDPSLQEMWQRIARTYSMDTDPPGAEVSFKEYLKPESEWIPLGITPLKDIKLPRGFYRWRLEKPGFETVETCGGSDFTSDKEMTLVLKERGTAPEGMVFVPGGKFSIPLLYFEHLKPVQAPGYWINRDEVTCQDFKEFIDQGGYRDPRWWKQKFARDGKELSFEEAVAGFTDRTGQPGPCTWEGGAYRPGEGNHPVTGVSWYEAAAYAEFAGKSLPTVFHWAHTAGISAAGWIIPLSNFGGKGTAPAGSHLGLSPNGARDMAGNAREWCFNEDSGFPGRRIILGGAWNENPYLFTHHGSLDPWDRSQTNGFRCVKYPDGETVPAELFDPLGPKPFRDLTAFQTASEEEFQIYRRELYNYEKTPLKATLEEVETSSTWRREKISMDAAYSGERLVAYLFLPNRERARPRYQTVVYSPHAGSQQTDAFEMQAPFTEMVIESGRALLFPIYEGTFNRRHDKMEPGMIGFRDWAIRIAKDMRRTIDYLETREDIDKEWIAYYGVSYGGWVGAVLMAVEDRFRCGILVAGGLIPYELPPPVDPVHCAPRIRAPVLMINGRYDSVFPLEESQKQLFHLLGTPPEKKRHIIYEAPHSLEYQFGPELRRDILEWLDRWLGLVR